MPFVSRYHSNCSLILSSSHVDCVFVDPLWDNGLVSLFTLVVGCLLLLVVFSFVMNVWLQRRKELQTIVPFLASQFSGH